MRHRLEADKPVSNNRYSKLEERAMRSEIRQVLHRNLSKPCVGHDAESSKIYICELGLEQEIAIVRKAEQPIVK